VTHVDIFITVLVIIAVVAVTASYLTVRLWLDERQRLDDLVRRLAVEARIEAQTVHTMQAMRQAARAAWRQGERP